jgi:hypothetical protein
MGKYNYDDSDYDGIGGGLGLPFVGIRQNDLKDEDGKQIIQSAGSFKWNDETPDSDEIAMLVLFSHPGKSNWPKDADRPDCKSFNAKNPMNPATAWSASCEICDKGQWQGKTPPECQDILQILAITYNQDTDEYTPFILQVKGKGMAPAKKFLQAIKTHARTDDLAPWHYPVIAKTKYVNENNYKYYVNVFDCGDFTPLDEEMIARVDEIRESMKFAWDEAMKSPTITPALDAGTRAQLPGVAGILYSGEPEEEKKEIPTQTLEGSPFKMPDQHAFDNE